MRPIYEAEVAQIDIVSTCHLKCANCTRFIGHHSKNYAMSEDCFRDAIRSLDGFPGRIGLMGGEPCLHPRFRQMLAIYREMVPRYRREFWTSGWKWTEYAEEISDTFDPELIHYNDHTQDDGKHQPLGVAIKDVVDDEDLMWELIGKCPFQQHWSPVINDKGAFFCEIAGAQDRVTNGPGGWKVEPGWWNKQPHEFQDQVARYCPNCSGCLPMPAYSDGRGGRDGPTKDVMTQSFYDRLVVAGSPKARKGHVEIWDRKVTRDDLDQIKDWSPRSFRGFVAHKPEDYEGAM